MAAWPSPSPVAAGVPAQDEIEPPSYLGIVPGPHRPPPGLSSTNRRLRVALSRLESSTARSCDQNGLGYESFHSEDEEPAVPTEERVACLLEEAQTSLAAQHQCVLRLFAKRIENSAMLDREVENLKAENIILRARMRDADCFPRGAGPPEPPVPLPPSAEGMNPEPLHCRAAMIDSIPGVLGSCASSMQVAPFCGGAPAPSPHTLRLEPPKVRVSGPDSARQHDHLPAEGMVKQPSEKQRRGSAQKWELLAAWQHKADRVRGGVGNIGSITFGKDADGVASRMARAHRSIRGSVQGSSDEHVDDPSGLDVTLANVNTSTTACRHLIIHPYDPKRSAWDVSSLVLVLWDMLMIPLGFFDVPEGAFLVSMQWVTRIFWTVDMPLSFLSGYLTAAGAIELRPWVVAKRYLRTWFSMDCLVVGIDWFEILLSAAAEGLGFARLGKATRIFRIIRMVRLLRLARMREVLNLLTERVNSERLVIFIDIAKLMVIMVSAGHIIACVWYAIAKGQQRSWVSEYGYDDEDLEYRYVMSLRWAISQFAGGMDEVTPQSLEESIFAICVYLTAFWAGAVFLSILTSSMTQLYIVGSQNAQQLTVLRRYLTQYRISKRLFLRVQRNAQHAMAERQRALPETSVSLIKLVSEPLRVELHFEMYSPLLSKHPFFARYVEECPHVMRRVCHGACTISQVSIGDVIFSTGEIPAQPMFFIIDSGMLQYLAMNGEKTFLAQDRWISEQNLWVSWTHRGMLTVVKDTRICMMNAQDFQNIVGQFEHMAFDPLEYAVDFVRTMNEAAHEASDLAIEDRNVGPGRCDDAFRENAILRIYGESETQSKKRAIDSIRRKTRRCSSAATLSQDVLARKMRSRRSGSHHERGSCQGSVRNSKRGSEVSSIASSNSVVEDNVIKTLSPLVNSNQGNTVISRMIVEDVSSTRS